VQASNRRLFHSVTLSTKHCGFRFGRSDPTIAHSSAEHGGGILLVTGACSISDRLQRLNSALVPEAKPLHGFHCPTKVSSSSRFAFFRICATAAWSMRGAIGFASCAIAHAVAATIAPPALKSTGSTLS
jgi:hypothetical protein